MATVTKDLISQEVRSAGLVYGLAAGGFAVAAIVVSLISPPPSPVRVPPPAPAAVVDPSPILMLPPAVQPEIQYESSPPLVAGRPGERGTIGQVIIEMHAPAMGHGAHTATGSTATPGTQTGSQPLVIHR